MGDADSSGSAPFFIVGASRSGTTMLRLLLNAHSRLFVPRELKYFPRVGLAPGDADWRRPAADRAEMERFVARYFEVRKTLFEDVDPQSLVDSILSSTTLDYRVPYVAAMNALTRHHDKVRWGEKTPANLFYCDILADMFPDARFVYIVRDPRAVVNSMNGIRYYSDDTALNARNWFQSATDGYELLVSSVPDSQRTVVRYQDLVSDPANTLRGLMAFLGEAYEPSMLSFYEDSKKHMPDQIRSPLVTAPVSKENAEKWRDQLDATQVAIIEDICGNAMDRFGFARESGGLSPLMRLRLRMKLAYWDRKRAARANIRSYEVAYKPFERLRRLTGASKTD